MKQLCHLTVPFEIHENFCTVYAVSADARVSASIPWWTLDGGERVLRCAVWWDAMRRAKTMEDWKKKLVTVSPPLADVAQHTTCWTCLAYLLVASLTPEWDTVLALPNMHPETPGLIACSSTLEAASHDPFVDAVHT